MLNEKLKKLRLSRKLTQEDLANQLNVSRQAITKWERGDGLPDIENLKQISSFFNLTIDELINNNDIICGYSYASEFELDHSKKFDIHLKEISEIELCSTNLEKLRIETTEEVEIKMDDHGLKNQMDININNKNYNIRICIPEKYLEKMEINLNAKKMKINNLNFNRLEIGGKLKYLDIINSKSNITLDTSRSDIEVSYDEFIGSLEVNLISSTARIKLPEKSSYQTLNKGRKTTIINNKDTDNASNTIELNGLNSRLIIEN